MYYPYVEKSIGDKADVLDIGCGDGELARFLSDKERYVIGLDISDECITKAQELTGETEKIKYVNCSFEKFDAKGRLFDAVVFVASIHHMDMEKAIVKAKALLRENGKLVIVGIAAPSSLVDWMVEALRIIPCKIGSAFHRMQSSEKLNIPTSYTVLKMSKIRKIVSAVIPKARLKYGLYYRYILTWENKNK